jgi:hypothetical protein
LTAVARSSGSLVAQGVAADGTTGEQQTLDERLVGVTLSDTDPAGRPVLAWRVGESLGIRVALARRCSDATRRTMTPGARIELHAPPPFDGFPTPGKTPRTWMPLVVA